MARVRSTLYPELYVADLDVQFRAGVADVRSKPKLTALARLDGIEIDTKDDDAGGSGSADGAVGDDGSTE